MNENAKLWLETLEKGEFPDGTKFGQTKQRLRATHAIATKDDIKSELTNEFCCLGVACELYRQVTGDGRWDTKGTFETGDFHRSHEVMPYPVTRWLEMFSGSGIDAEHIQCLAELNDAGATFTGIAAIARTEAYFKGDNS